MNHAITIGGLLLGAIAFWGALMGAIGVLMFFAGMMSDAGDDGTSGRGAIIFFIGLALFIGGLIGLFA